MTHNNAENNNSGKSLNLKDLLYNDNDYIPLPGNKENNGNGNVTHLSDVPVYVPEHTTDVDKVIADLLKSNNGHNSH